MSYDLPPKEELDPKIAEELQARGIPVIDPSTVLNGIANQIVSNEHFCAFLLNIDDARRKDAYDALKPRLRFNVQPFSMLMSRSKKVTKKLIKRAKVMPRSEMKKQGFI